ncbi:hypothetical protein ACE1TH_10855 [Shouchella sp. JSM 1781072]|uniref:hypothetical protein n=1 Tax=Shouchella sp. JSM 1781072 TaxID=3344581 RepID=UPI0035C12ECB
MMRVSDLPRKTKWYVFLVFPLGAGGLSYVLRALLEVGWPDMGTALAMTIGFFIGSSSIAFMKTDWLTRHTQPQTRKQKRIKDLLVVLLILLFAFILIRFFVIFLN